MKTPNFFKKIIDKRLNEIKSSIIYKIYLYLKTTIGLKLLFKKTNTTILAKSYKKMVGEGWVILHYQRICSPKNVPFALPTHSFVEEKTFQKHCKWLKEEADIIPLNQLLDHIENNTPIPTRSIVITFENGFLDGYNKAAPILADNELPCTFSLPTAYIGTESYLLYDLLAVYLNALYVYKVQLPSLSLIEKELDNIILQTLDENNLPTIKTHQALINICYGLNNSQRNNLFSVLSKLVLDYNIEIPPWRDFMNWEEVDVLSEATFQVISQLNSNPWISLLKKEELLFELYESDKKLSNYKSYRSDIISIPYGFFSNESVNYLEQLGIRYGLVHNMGPSINEQRTENFNDKLKILTRLNLCEANTHSKELFFSRIWGADFSTSIEGRLNYDR